LEQPTTRVLALREVARREVAADGNAGYGGAPMDGRPTGAGGATSLRAHAPGAIQADDRPEYPCLTSRHARDMA